ncbi:unnamed protein product [Cuscuta campestris]|uniref:Gnk2-homologous domain-containing protein n=1 Tax=Cuscuta campestris TaxID=132261 RepID=A0A484KKF8_9ASTE|nr:unnamed protein product [Cuscuta campestris]
MKSSVYTPSVLFALLAIFFNGLTAAQVCSQTAGNFTANGTYAGNRARLFSSFSSNLSSTYGFFMNTTVGHGADRIYGIALCRADSPRETCNECINSGIKELADSCPNQIEAINWAWVSPFSCFVRYSNRSLSGKSELSPSEEFRNSGVFTSDETDRIKPLWENHISSLIAAASMGTKIKYASGERNFSDLMKIYALVQCTPDLSRRDCESCLTQTVIAFQSCCGKNHGGSSYTPSCIFRWDLYPFYNNHSSFTGSSPPPANPPAALPFHPPANAETSTGNGRRISSRTVAIISAPIAVAFSGVLAAVVIFRRMTKRSGFHGRLAAEERGNGECMQFKLATVRIATNNFSHLNKLGQGGFGSVFKVEWGRRRSSLLSHVTKCKGSDSFQTLPAELKICASFDKTPGCTFGKIHPVS